MPHLITESYQGNEMDFQIILMVGIVLYSLVAGIFYLWENLPGSNFKNLSAREQAYLRAYRGIFAYLAIIFIAISVIGYVTPIPLHGKLSQNEAQLMSIFLIAILWMIVSIFDMMLICQKVYNDLSGIEDILIKNSEEEEQMRVKVKDRRRANYFKKVR